MADNIFEGLFETPLEAQKRRRDLMLAQLQQQPNSAGRFGVALGTALRGAVNRYRTGEKGQGLFHRLSTGYASKEEQQAHENQEIMASVAQDTDAALKAGADPMKAQAAALMRAAVQFSARGRGSEAQQLQSQAMQLRAQIEVREAELGKLRAETREANAHADALGAPEAPKDELTRMQDQRASLSSQLTKADAGSPTAAALAQLIDETDQRIQKIITITGRTDVDAEALGLTKPTINALQKSIIDNQSQLDLITEGINGLDPNFYTLAGRVKSGKLWLRDIIGSDLSQEEKTFLIDRTQNVQAWSQGLNAYIKAVTGAQMAVAEADRLSKDVPQPGDGPTVLQAKADRWAWRLPAINARAQAALAADDLSIINTPLEKWRVKDPDDEVRAAARRVLGLP